MSQLKLKYYRNKMKLSQRQLASKLNITQQAYWKWEKGLSFPNSTQILKLCEIFNVTPNDLFGIKGVHAVAIDPLFENYNSAEDEKK